MFTDEQKRCFKYSDGISTDRFGDPVDILERIRIYARGNAQRVVEAAFPKPIQMMKSQAGGDGDPIEVPQYEEVVQEDDDGNPVLGADGKPVKTVQPKMLVMTPSLEEREAYYDMIAFGFKVQRVDEATGKGYTKRMLNALWDEFNDWLDEKKEAPASSPTPSKPSEGVSLPA